MSWERDGGKNANTNQQLGFDPLKGPIQGHFLLPQVLVSPLLFQLTLLQHSSFVEFHPERQELKKTTLVALMECVLGVDCGCATPLLELGRSWLLSPVRQLPQQQSVDLRVVAVVSL